MTPREKLIALRDALRAPMPRGFRWDYRQIGTVRRSGSKGPVCGCAINLAVRIGVLNFDSDDRCAEFGITTVQWAEIFGLAGNAIGKSPSEVTPADCATAIDRVLAEGE